MDIVFKKAADNFIETLKLYTQDKATYKELEESSIFYEIAMFGDISYMRTEIFTFKIDQYKQACELERNIKKAKMSIENDDLLDDEIIEKIVDRGMYLGYAKKNCYGQSLPAYPMLNMMTIEEEIVEDDHVTTEEVFKFEL